MNLEQIAFDEWFQSFRDNLVESFWELRWENEKLRRAVMAVGVTTEQLAEIDKQVRRDPFSRDSTYSDRFKAK